MAFHSWETLGLSGRCEFASAGESSGASGRLRRGLRFRVTGQGGFANFVVQLPLDGDEKDILRTVSMANSIRQWRDIEPGDPSVAEVDAVVKDEAIDDLASYLGPGNAAHFAEPNPTLFNTFQLDLGRATVVIGDRIHEVNRTNVADGIRRLSLRPA